MTITPSEAVQLALLEIGPYDGRGDHRDYRERVKSAAVDYATWLHPNTIASHHISDLKGHNVLACTEVRETTAGREVRIITCAEDLGRAKKEAPHN